MLFTLQFSN